MVTKTRILLVAEEAARAARVQPLLEENGSAVFHVPSISDALEALDMQRFDFVLIDSAPGSVLNRPALNRFQPIFQNHNRPQLVLIREDLTATNPFRLASRAEQGVDAVIEGWFSSSRLVELVSQLINRRELPPSPAAAPETGSQLPVFDRGQFELQMNYDQHLMAEIIQLFFTETNQQVAELQRSLAAGLGTQAKRLAHTLKGSFGAVYARRASAIAREIEEAVASDLPAAARLMPRLLQATTDIQNRLLELITE
jgi:HPt (histidine-containing phosphotransfer) domain-containing protein